MHLDSERFRARLHDRDGLRMAAVGDEDRRLPRHSCWQRGRCACLGGGGRFVEQRGVGNVQPGEVDDHLLEVDQRLHAPLRNLRLIRRVGGVPAGIFEDVPLDHRRHDAVAVALAEVVFENLVPAGDGAQLRQRLMLPARHWQVQFLLQPDRRRHGRIDQRIEGRLLHRREHFRDFVRIRAQMATRKGVAGIEGIDWFHSRFDKAVVHRRTLGIGSSKASGISPASVWSPF